MSPRASALLETIQRDRVIFFRVPRPVASADEITRLGWEVADACDQIEQSTERPVAVVLRGSHEAFMRRPPETAEDLDAAAGSWAALVGSVTRLTAPTIASLEGDAVGPAWDLALACDIRLARIAVRVGSPEVRLGRMPGAGATQRLPRLVGQGAALRLLLFGDVLGASEAFELGLLHHIVPADGFDLCVEEMAAGLRLGAPVALAYAKEALQRGVDLPLAEGLRLEADLATLLQTTHDRAEGIAAFIERRPARLEGR